MIRRGVRAAAVFVFLYGAILAPTLHHAFHHDDHIHAGDTIIYLDDPDIGNVDGDDEPDEQEIEEFLHLSSQAAAGRSHPHDHHEGRDHGSTSLWHFGAALGDHVDGASGLVAIAVLDRIRPIPEPRRESLAARAVPHLRGPPQLCAV